MTINGYIHYFACADGFIGLYMYMSDVSNCTHLSMSSFLCDDFTLKCQGKVHIDWK